MSDEPYSPRLPDPRMIPPSRPNSWLKSITENERNGHQDGESVQQDASDAFVRPFIVTLGRTRPRRDGLRIETLVLAKPAALTAPLRFEQRRIVELCQNPMSLAEVAVGLGVPIGVARVLVADLYTAHHVLVREPTELSVHIIERIRDLVRAL